MSFSLGPLSNCSGTLETKILAADSLGTAANHIPVAYIDSIIPAPPFNEDLQTTCSFGNTTDTGIVVSAGDVEVTAGDVTAGGDFRAPGSTSDIIVGQDADIGRNLITGQSGSGGSILMNGNGSFLQTGTNTFQTASGANKLLGRINSQAGIDIPLTNDGGTQIPQNSIKNNTTFEAQVKFLGQINGTISSPESCPVFPNAQYKTYTLDTTLPKQEYALSLLATGSAGSLMFDLHTAHGNFRQNYSMEVNSFCADEKGILPAPYVVNWAVYPPNDGTSNTDACIQINYTDYDASATQVMRVDIRIFYNPSPP